ncbi:hypothetical protein M426DRAFT_18264 [Hypoxylon sp. CI-4A]|nr:hypothetical protein M426DRAFT_18264 [Hypoxylon sp. CI-4A]
MSTYRKDPLFDPYEVLGLPRTASAGEIRSRYRDLCFQTHPDKAGNEGWERFARIQDAYESLCQPSPPRVQFEEQRPEGKEKEYRRFPSPAPPSSSLGREKVDERRRKWSSVWLFLLVLGSCLVKDAIPGKRRECLSSLTERFNVCYTNDI